MKKMALRILTLLILTTVFAGASFVNFVTATEDKTPATGNTETKNLENAGAKTAENAEDPTDGSLIVKADDKAEVEPYGEVTEVTDHIYIVKTENAETADDAAEALDNNPKVQAVLPNIKLETQSIRDPQYYSWGTTATGSDHYVDWLNYLKTKGKNPRNLVVAVIDSGIWRDHEVFKDDAGQSRLCSGELANYAKRYSYKNNDIIISDDIDDVDGHGTNTAGIVAQATPNNVCIIPVRVTENGVGDLLSVIQALVDVSRVADIVNMSLGTSDHNMTAKEKADFDEIMVGIIQAHPVTVVASAGNNSESFVSFPSSSEHIISVSALKRNGSNYAFDNGYSNFGKGVAFSMPGTSVLVPASQLAPGNFYYETSSGTSYSSPHLAATAALLRSDPEYNYTGTTDFSNQNDVFTGLKKNATYLGTTSSKWDKFYGYGMVDFGANMFTPGRISASWELSADHKSATISGFALGANQITGYAVTESKVAPSSWTNITSTAYGFSFVAENLTANVSENGTYYLWIKDRNGKTGYTTLDISGIEVSQLISDGIYIIHSALDYSKVLDVIGASADNLANVQLYNDVNSIGQKFFIRHLGGNNYQIENLKSRKNLDVIGAGVKNCTNVEQYVPNSSCAQKWRARRTPDGYISFVSTCSGLYLDIIGGDTKNGANVQIYSGNNSKAQKFTLETFQTAPAKRSVADGTYKITSALDSNKVLDIIGALKNDGANLQLYTSLNNNAQKFNITHLRDGFYKIINVNSNKALDVIGAGIQNGTNVWQYSWNGTIAQQWMIVKTSDNYYTFISRCNGLNLDISGGSSKNGANAQIYARNNTKAQKFTLTKL